MKQSKAKEIATAELNRIENKTNVTGQDYRNLEKISVYLVEEENIESEKKLRALLRAKIEKDIEERNKKGFITPLEEHKSDKNPFQELLSKIS